MLMAVALGTAVLGEKGAVVGTRNKFTDAERETLKKQALQLRMTGMSQKAIGESLTLAGQPVRVSQGCIHYWLTEQGFTGRAKREQGGTAG